MYSFFKIVTEHFGDSMLLPLHCYNTVDLIDF